MKIEKLTENKIRIIMSQEDLENQNIDLHTIMTKTTESQRIFLKLLNKAQKEVNFNTDGCKLLIEAFSCDGFLVFTITKYLDTSINKASFPDSNKKTLKVKRKTTNQNSALCIYSFSDFETFCNLCNFFKNTPSLSIRGLVKEATLYEYNNTYYLLLNHINLTHKNLTKFYSYMSEFAQPISHSAEFESKIKEHGKSIIKNNALNTGIKYFAN